MTLTERTQKVLTEIDAALGLAEKATPGPWAKDWGRVRGDQCETVCQVERPNDFMEEPWISDAAFIAASRTLLPASLRCLKTAIEGLSKQLNADYEDYYDVAGQRELLTTLCDQWEAGR